MKSKILFITILLLVCLKGLQAQVTKEWSMLYIGPGPIDIGRGVVTDNSGNVYVACWSSETGQVSNFLTIKYSPSGTLLWTRSYNGTANSTDIIEGIGIDGSGNIYVTGYASEISTGYDYVTIKYNPDGDSLWVRKYNSTGSANDYVYSIYVTSNGNVFVTGGGGLDYVTVAYNSSGDLLWSALYPDGGTNTAYAVTGDQSGNVYVTGRSVTSGTGEFATVKYNSSGIQQWASRYSAPANHNAYSLSIAAANSGNVYITGYYYHDADPTSDMATLKYNSAGVQQWIKTYNGPLGTGRAVSVDLEIDNMENVYVTGTSSDSVMTTLKYNTDGNPAWAHRSMSYTDGYCIKLDTYNNVYVTGTSGAQSFFNRIITEKYDSAGNQQWQQIYGQSNPGYSYPTAMTLDALRNVIITGSDTQFGTNDCVTIKYSQPMGITQISSSHPADFNLSQNYPNPFNPETVISYSIPSNVKGQTSNVKLIVYDVLGDEVTTLVNQKQNAGSYEVEFDGSNFSSGIYFYKITAGEFSDTKKMTLIK